jgi:hypothetical protein
MSGQGINSSVANPDAITTAMMEASTSASTIAIKFTRSL